MDPWIDEHAARIAAHAERELEALVAISTPSGDVRGAEEAAALVAAAGPDDTEIERPAGSTPRHAPDLLVRQRGTGSARILLLGHLDTVVSHDEHQPLRRDGDQLVGSGSIDMKGGDVLALGVLRRLATRREDIAEVALLLVCDEEWRTGALRPRRALRRLRRLPVLRGRPARPRPATMRWWSSARRRAPSRCARTGALALGSAPDRGRNALLALAAAAQAIAGCHDPDGPDHLTAVPTVMNSGDAFNVVRAPGRLLADSRADARGLRLACSRGSRPRSAAPSSSRGWSACGPGWTRARPPAACWNELGGRRATGDRRPARRRQRRQPLRLDDRHDGRRARPAGRRRARPVEHVLAAFAALASRDRAGSGGRRPVDLSAGHTPKWRKRRVKRT